MVSVNNDFDSIMKQMLNSINYDSEQCDTGSSSSSSGSTGQANKDSCIKLTPSQIIVIAGLLGGVLAVESVLVDRNQVINVVLSGSLRRKTDLDKMVQEIGSKSFKEVLSSFINNTR